MINTDNKTRYKTRKYLHLCKPRGIESIFLRMFETKEKNTINGYMHKYPKVLKGELTIYLFLFQQAS